VVHSSAAARHSRRTVIGVAVALVSLLVLLVSQLRDAQAQARIDVEERFVARVEAASAFVTGIVQEQIRRQRTHARDSLAGASIDPAALADMVRAFDLDAAVLLDDVGRALGIHPAERAPVGTDLAAQHEHLRRAVDGMPAVSGLIPATVERQPVVAVAIPFGTPHGRRVFSGELVVARTPIQGYLDNAITTDGYEGYVIDQDRNVLAAHRPRAASRTPTIGLGTTLATTPQASYSDPGGDERFLASRPIDGTPWRVIATVPRTQLSGPLGRTASTQWFVLLAFSITGVLALILLVRLGRQTAELEHLASVDPLTGLPNRRRLDEMAVDAEVGVLLIDLDHFKTVNDRLGHAGGDDALMIVAARVRGIVRSTDIPVRWGGEEFLVYQPDTTPGGVAATAERIRRAVRQPMTIGDDELTMTCSVGWATGTSEQFDLLVRRADEALYEAKAAGRDCVTAWTESPAPVH
jgi:diguanylate cyclase (GGDEF)-like protein